LEIFKIIFIYWWSFWINTNFTNSRCFQRWICCRSLQEDCRKIAGRLREDCRKVERYNCIVNYFIYELQILFELQIFPKIIFINANQGFNFSFGAVRY